PTGDGRQDQAAVGSRHQGDHRKRCTARGRHRTAGRPDRLRHRIRFDERLGGAHYVPRNRRPRRQVLGAGLRHAQGPRALARRTAQYVEADAAGSAMVPRWQPAPVALLFALPGIADQSPDGGHCAQGLRPADRPPSAIAIGHLPYEAYDRAWPEFTLVVQSQDLRDWIVDETIRL